jgi:hypothetical protein
MNEFISILDPSRPLACHKCPLRYKNKDQLVRHVQTHEKPDIECELCHRVFGRPDHLKRHIATKHSSLSPVEQVYLSETLNKKSHGRKTAVMQPQSAEILHKLEPEFSLVQPQFSAAAADILPNPVAAETETTTMFQLNLTNPNDL